MDYNKVLNQVMVLFLILIVGYFARKKQLMNDDLNNGLSQILVKITMPLMILSSFNYSFSKEIMSNSVKLLIFSCVVNFIIIVLSGGFKLFIKDKRAAVLRFGLIFSNFGFMGFPVIESIYGSKGVLYAAIFNIPFNILVWTYGIYIMNDNKIEGGYKKAIFNEGTIATFVGIFLFLFSIKLPYPIQRTTEIIGGMTTPLSMIIIGSMLGGIELKETLRGLELYVFAFLRLLVAPVIALIVVYLIGGRGITLGIPVVITGMPAAATTAIYAQVYSPEVKAFASKAVFISTIFSLISIPLIIYIIKMITG